MSSKKKSNNNQKTVVETPEQQVETPIVENETQDIPIVVTTSETPDTPVVTETPEAPKDETPQPEEKKEEVKEEPKEEKKSETKKKKEINISTDIEVRYAATFSNKRIATVRKMPLYTIIYTYIHNRSAFLGLVYASQLDEIFKYILGNNIVIEGVKISDQLKKDLYLKIKSDTDYVKIKWGSK